MMNSVARKARIRHKLIIINLSTTGAALLIAGVALMISEYVSLRDSLVQNLTAQAKILANNSTAPLTFDDRKAANETLSAVKASPDIDRAMIYDKERRSFAEYRSTRDEEDAPPAPPRRSEHSFDHHHLHLFQGIELDGETIGMIYLRYDLGALYSLMMRSGAVAAAVIAIVFGAAFMLLSGLQKMITAPLLNLADLMRAVSRDKNYSLKASLHSEDEIGSLAEGFNEMLGQIQRRDTELQTEIVERTRAEEELREKNRMLIVMSECNEALVHTTTETELLDTICRIVVETGGYRLAWVGYAEHGAGQRVHPVAQAGCEDMYPDVAGITWAEAEGTRGPAGAAIREGRPVVVKNILTDSIFAPCREEALARGYTSSIALPLIGKDGCEGALSIYAQEADAFDDEEVKLLTELAGDLCFGIQSLRTGAERNRADEALRQRQRAIEASCNGIMISDVALPDNPLIYVNPAFERITGYSAQEALGRDGRFLMGDDREQMGLEEIRAALREQREGHAVLRNYRKDGSLFWNDLSIAPVRDETGKVTHVVGIINDITERKRYEEQLEFQANHDGLTGLPNRNLLADRIQQALSYARRYDRRVAVLLVDLDHFKFVNDSLGHEIGDRLLRLFAERLTSCVRSGDTVARHGGDEFIIVLADMAKTEDAALVARKIHRAVSQPLEVDGHELFISCSIGISAYPRDGKDASILLKNADSAMYRAKEQGRNSFQFYSGALNDQVVARMTMEMHLRRAVERDELSLHYQPQVDLNTGRVTGIEALLRWKNPDLGMVPPAKFIPLAEETGLIIPIGEWVLKTACIQNRSWQNAGLSPLTIAVNLSACQFRHYDLIGTVSQSLQESGLEPRYLELEIVESMVLQNTEKAAAMLKGLKELGVQLTIDDFGTGYSSLSYLKRFPFDKLKIDISFVREITNDPGSAAIARTIIAMARNLNLQVIAEGVETEGQLSYLRTHGCDEMQGFYFSKPVPARDLESLLRENRHLRFPEGSSAAAGRTLLLIDDKADVTESLEGILSGDGYRILSASNAEKGFELLALNDVGVVVSDQRMPGMSGTEFLSRVKELHPDTVRIMLSAYPDFDVVSEAVNRGGIFKFLIKPCREDSLRENIREAFKYYELTKGKR